MKEKYKKSQMFESQITEQIWGAFISLRINDIHEV